MATAATADPTGAVAGFADATGHFLPLVCTLNAARVLDVTAAMLGVDHDELSSLALSVSPGADGLVLVPYLEGERTPNRPRATGALHGMRLANSTRAHLARAAVEGMLCALADGLDALVAHGVPLRRVVLVGGGARSAAVRAIAPTVFGVPVACRRRASGSPTGPLGRPPGSLWKRTGLHCGAYRGRIRTRRSPRRLYGRGMPASRDLVTERREA